MRAYHDREWGVPTWDDRVHFEFLVLESAQAGLSWRTILHRRGGYRRAFADFDPQAVARFGARDEARLLKDAGIIRNTAKVRAAIANARHFLAVQEEHGSFAAYLWGFVDGTPVVRRRRSLAEIPPRTALSDAVSRDLRARGFTFVGSVVVYSHLQATGLVNDHLVTCPRWAAVQERAADR